MLASCIGIWLGLLGVGELEIKTEVPGLHEEAFEAGLRARVGQEFEGWKVELSSGAQADHVVLRFEGPGQNAVSKSLTVTADDPESRSRELAVAVALVLEDYRQHLGVNMDSTPAGSGGSAVAKGSPRMVPFVGVGPRFELGRDLTPFGGLAFSSGLWLPHVFVVPRGELSWIATTKDGLGAHLFRLGLGADVGAPVSTSYWWLGAYMMGRGGFVAARGESEVFVGSGGGEIGGVVTYWGDWLYFSGRSGIALALPPTTIRGGGSELRVGNLSWVLGVDLGLRF